METEKDISHFDDIGFSVVATLGENKHFVEFLAYKHLTETTFKTDPPIRTFIADDSEVCDIPTEDIENAEIYLEGTIKFDGCSNWDFKTDEELKHFCSVEKVEEFGELMRRTYNIFDIIMETYKK